jgi:hypothetical protein
VSPGLGITDVTGSGTALTCSTGASDSTTDCGSVSACASTWSVSEAGKSEAEDTGGTGGAGGAEMDVMSSEADGASSGRVG